ncbi:MAG: hypothetical protein RBT34_03350 [Anaerolineaceae bacterium]|nr:hypothetical protein [Anaerolineaceae bacterium]
MLSWIARVGITAALGMLIFSVWPPAVGVQSQRFEFPADEIPQSTLQFRAPEQLYRGQWADFSVILDMDRKMETDGDIHPVMVYRLELDGAESIPEAVYQIPLAGVQHQEAGWRVRFPRTGDYQGTWWVYVEYVGQRGEVIDRQALFARRFIVESRGILGLSVTGARWVSAIMLLGLFGLTLIFPP